MTTPTTHHDDLAATATTLRRYRRRHRHSWLLKVTILVALACGGWVASLMVGETFYSLPDVIGVVLGHDVPGASFTVAELRLPRATVALAAGAALGVSGVVFQTLLHNELASPDIIGISSAASASGVIALVWWGTSQTMASAIALASTLAVAAVIYLLAHRGGFAGSRLILIGIGVGAMLNSVVTFVVSRAAAWDLNTAARWVSGSLNTMSFERGLPLLLTAMICVPALAMLSHQLTVMGVGDDLATALGLRLRLIRALCISGAVALLAVATAATGPIAFVAFMSGPLAGRIVGRATPLILPAGVVGALLVLGSDLAGQYLFGTRYPVGVITGALGAPFLLVLLASRHRAQRS